MTREEVSINAPVIAAAAGDAQLEAVISARAKQIREALTVDEQRKNILGMVKPGRKLEAAPSNARRHN